jgi:hypothetical protein
MLEQFARGDLDACLRGPGENQRAQYRIATKIKKVVV